MKIKFFIGTLLLFLTAGVAVNAKNIKAIFSYSRYMQLGAKPYVETYLLVNGNSVVYSKKENGKYEAKVSVILKWLQNEKVVKQDQYNLLSPETSDTAFVDFNFIDQQRYSLPNGSYVLELKISDVNDTKPGFVTAIPVEIAFPSLDSLSISDIHLVAKATKAEKMGPITKSGYDLVPRISAIYASDADQITFYTEFYNADKKLGEKVKFLATAELVNRETQKKVSSTYVFRKMEAAKVNVFLQTLSLKDVRSGTYDLVISAINASNEVIASQKIEIQRISSVPEIDLADIEKVSLEESFYKGYPIDSLKEFIACLYPISTIFERRFQENQLKGDDRETMEKFLLNFWQQRNASNPQLAWENYKKQVNIVNKQFGTLIRKGYETDRGRVYLQYGTPDTRNQNYREPSAYPYEIWHYYKIGNQTNRRFVFYNPDLISNDFQLIYSNANGEIMDEQWQFKIMRRDSQTIDMDQNNTNRHWGSQLQDNFQLPR
jgi:GWxTD domain-containing protein